MAFMYSFSQVVRVFHWHVVLIRLLSCTTDMCIKPPRIVRTLAIYIFLFVKNIHLEY